MIGQSTPIRAARHGFPPRFHSPPCARPTFVTFALWSQREQLPNITAPAYDVYDVQQPCSLPGVNLTPAYPNMKPNLHRLLFAAALIGAASIAAAQSQTGPEKPGESTAKTGQTAPKAEAKTTATEPAMTASTEASSTEAATEAETETKGKPAFVQMQKLEIIGSHIHDVDLAGISPTTTITQEYIQTSGFQTTDDLLRSLPQVYSGAGAGRGSVPNGANPGSGTSSFAFNYTTYAPDIGQTGVSGVSLRGLGGGDTLVLIDGRRAPLSGIGNRNSDTNASFFDINTIPLGMIDHIDVLTDGASAIYGSDAVGGVINIVLKKHFVGSELDLSYKTSQHGGGTEYTGTLTNGFAQDKLSGTVVLTYYRNLGLKASQRPFSASADHTAQGGQDLRLTYGFPATVKSYGGGWFGPPPLGGLTDSHGNPVYTAFVPVGQNGTGLTPGSFIPLETPAGKYYPYTYNPRAFDPAPFISIITPSKRWGGRVHLQYDVNSDVNVFTDVNFSRTQSNYTTTPPVASPLGGFSFGPGIVVPASDPDNPFHQDLTIGMALTDFGGRPQDTRTDATSFAVGAQGKRGDWDWNTALSYAVSMTHLIQSDLDFDLLNASFLNSDASQRFNPFVGEPSAQNAKLLQSFSKAGYVTGFSGLAALTANVSGPVYQLPGGPWQVAAGGEYDQYATHTTTTQTFTSGFSNSSPFFNGQMPYSSIGQDTYALYAETVVPLFGKPNAVPGAQRLDLQAAVRYEDNGPANSTTPKVGLAWAPVKSVLLRSSYSQGFRSASLTEFQQTNYTSTTSVQDPLRGNSSYQVNVLNGSRDNVQPETSDIYNVGLVIEPPFAKGLSLHADFNQTKQDNIIQVLNVSDIVANESALPGRVLRAPPVPGDPFGVGTITSVDDRLDNFGRIKTSYVDYTLAYDLPTQNAGRFNFTVVASRTLDFDYELRPGQQFVSQNGDTAAPPKWKGTGSFRWTKGSWTAALYAYYTGGFDTNNSGNALDGVLDHIPSFTTFDVNVGYVFKQGIWEGHGKDVRLNVGIGNLTDKYPPFDNSIFGFNGALYSPLGRTFNVSLAIPF